MDICCRHLVCCSPFNDHESTFFISFALCLRYDFRWWSFFFSLPNAIIHPLFHVLFRFKLVESIEQKNYTHSHCPTELWIHTQTHTNLPFSFSFFHRVESEKAFIFRIFISRCYFRIWSWNVLFVYFFFRFQYYLCEYLRRTKVWVWAFSSFDLQVTKVVLYLISFSFSQVCFLHQSTKFNELGVWHRNFEAKIKKTIEDSVHYIRSNFDLLPGMLSQFAMVPIRKSLQRTQRRKKSK